LIVDRKRGAVLAHNFAAYTLEIMPTQVADFDECMIRNRLVDTGRHHPQGPQRVFQKLLEEGHDFASVPESARG